MRELLQQLDRIEKLHPEFSHFIAKIREFARSFQQVKELAVSYTTAQDEAKTFADRLKAAFPNVPVSLTRVGSSLGTHAGPGGMGIGVRET